MKKLIQYKHINSYLKNKFPTTTIHLFVVDELITKTDYAQTYITTNSITLGKQKFHNVLNTKSLEHLNRLSDKYKKQIDYHQIIKKAEKGFGVVNIKKVDNSYILENNPFGEFEILITFSKPFFNSIIKTPNRFDFIILHELAHNAIYLNYIPLLLTKSSPKSIKRFLRMNELISDKFAKPTSFNLKSLYPYETIRQPLFFLHEKFLDLKILLKYKRMPSFFERPKFDKYSTHPCLKSRIDSYKHNTVRDFNIIPPNIFSKILKENGLDLSVDKYKEYLNFFLL